MDDLKKGWPELVEIISIGNSSEGRELKGIRIGLAPPADAGGKKHKKSRGDDDEHKGRKKEFVVIGGQHGREWVAPATTLYFAHWLLVNVAQKDAVKHLLEEIDFTIIPVVNPDGYEYVSPLFQSFSPSFADLTVPLPSSSPSLPFPVVREVSSLEEDPIRLWICLGMQGHRREPRMGIRVVEV